VLLGPVGRNQLVEVSRKQLVRREEKSVLCSVVPIRVLIKTLGLRANLYIHGRPNTPPRLYPNLDIVYSGLITPPYTSLPKVVVL